MTRPPKFKSKEPVNVEPEPPVPPPAQLAYAPPPPFGRIDFSSFQPSQDTVQWLYTLPLPPGCNSQPLPTTPEDWALVEQYRLLCQGLLVMGEFERERRRRMDNGEDPWGDWDPRESGNPTIISAAQSLFKHDLAQHGDSAFRFPYPFSSSYPSQHPYPSADPEISYDDDFYSEDGVEGDFDGDNAVLATHTYDFPSLETLQSFASASPLDPSALPLSLDLSSLTLGPNGIGEVGEDGTPASLPSLMAAIAELEQCVARLSLEATEARNLQKTLREEMATRHHSQNGAAGGGPAQLQAKEQQSGPAAAALAGLARAGLKPMKRKVKGGRVVSVSSRSRLPPSLQKQKMVQPPSAAPVATNGNRDDSETGSVCGHAHCTDCGSHLSPSASPEPSDAGSDGGAYHSPPYLPLPTVEAVAAAAAADSAQAAERVARAQQAAVAAGQAGSAAAGKAWEDGELMKALQSVSMLDRRADEYRERLRVLKEQIHHHAAFADTLAATPPTDTTTAGAGAAPPAATAAPKGKFGESFSDGGVEWVSIDERRRALVNGQAGGRQ
ncbi:hypothetical protein JCM8547_006116 [Rhodosporidiobolus lusitaniae]